jgi:hypothetical protein
MPAHTHLLYERGGSWALVGRWPGMALTPVHHRDTEQAQPIQEEPDPRLIRPRPQFRSELITFLRIRVFLRLVV